MEKRVLQKKHKWLIAVLAFLLIAGIVIAIMLGGQQSLIQGNTIKIGVTMYRGDDTFISNMMESLQQIVREYETNGDADVHIYLSITDAQGSQSIQNGQIERFISLGYDILCVNLVDRTNAAYIIDKAMEADTPVVFFNREPVQADLQKWDKLYYVGTDAPLNGILQGQIIVDAYNKKPSSIDFNGDGIIQYIMIEGEFRHQDARLRTEGSVQTIRDAGINMEKLDGAIADWERSQAEALAKKYFEEYGEQIELVICNNDDMALGVIDTVLNLGLDFHNIVGIDGTPAGLDALEKGRMLGTVVISYDGQARLIFDIAYALGVGIDPAKVVDLASDNSVRAELSVITMDDYQSQNAP